jgi:hypothetical protein
MTLSEIRKRIADARAALASAGVAAAELEAMPADDLPLTPLAQAKFLLRVDRVADRAQDLADELALQVPEPTSEA